MYCSFVLSSNFYVGKPITTSVPSFSIRFHAGGEELEELYPSEEEEKSEISEKLEKSPIVEEKSSDGNGPGGNYFQLRL